MSAYSDAMPHAVMGDLTLTCYEHDTVTCEVTVSVLPKHQRPANLTLALTDGLLTLSSMMLTAGINPTHSACRSDRAALLEEASFFLSCALDISLSRGEACPRCVCLVAPLLANG